MSCERDATTCARLALLSGKPCPDHAIGAPAAPVLWTPLPAQPPADAPPSLKSRLLSPKQLRERPRPKHLIKDVLRLNSATWLIAQPGSFKSFVALDWAAHVASGREWNGHKTERRPVIYVLAEGVDGFQDRVTAWEIRHEVELDGLHVLPVAVQARGDDGRRVSADWRELAALVVELRPGLVVLDTQARLSVGLEENSNTEMGVWVAAVEMLREAAGCCVLVVHHTGRNGGDARGASALDGAQDMEWRVDREAHKLTCTISCDKNKDGSDDLKWTFPLDIVDVGFDEDGDKMTSLVLGKPIARRAIGPATEQIELTAAEGRSLDCYGVVHRVLDQLDPHRYGMTLAEVVRSVNAARKDAKLDPFKEAAVRSALNHGKTQGATDNGGRKWRLTDPAEGVDGLFGALAKSVAPTVADNGSDNVRIQRLATVDNASALPPLNSANVVSANGRQR